MEGTTKSKVIPTMAIISVIIIVLGIICSIAFYSVISAEIAQGADAELYVEGTNVAAAANKAGNLGAAVLSGLIVAVSFVLVVLQWMGYLVVKLIKSAMKNS